MPDRYNPSFATSYSVNPGRLDVDRPSRSSGKRAFLWTYTMAASNKVAEVEVHLVNAKDGQMSFKATSTYLRTPIEHADINALAQAVKAAMDHQAAAIDGVQWEDWLEVVVKGDNVAFGQSQHSGMGSNLQVQVNNLKRAIHPVTGKPITVLSNNAVVPFPEPTSLDATDPNEGLALRIHDRQGERSYIPDTPANRAALELLAGRMAQLRTNLANLLSQGQVEERLASLDPNIPLLKDS